MDRGPANYESIRDSLTSIRKTSRRRSLKTLFQLPLSTRGSVYAPIETAPTKGSLPSDVLLEIVEYLAPGDILSFSLTSTYIRTLLLPALYETVTLKSSRNCLITLPMLLKRKDICAHIRKLAVRPNYYLAWPRPDEHLDEGWVVRMIEGMSGSLRMMHTFDWDGLEVPRDSLWGVLRMNCPELKNVFSNVGTQPLDPNSALFDFSNLHSFSLIVRHGLGGSELFPTPEPLPPRFWRMLLTRCPDLQELAICSFSSSARVLDFNPLTATAPSFSSPPSSHSLVSSATATTNTNSMSISSANTSTSTSADESASETPDLPVAYFPKLHTLTLGSFGYQPDFSLGPSCLTGSSSSPSNPNPTSPTTPLSLTKFLDRHTSLKYIRFLWNFKRWMSPDAIPLPLAPTSLPNLDTFIGVYQQLEDLPPASAAKLENVDLTCEPIYENRVREVGRVLGRLGGLRSLDVWVHVFDSRRDNRGFFGELVGSVRGLEEFHFMCTTSFTAKPLKQLLTHLPLLPHLQKFSLTKGHKYTDESMLATALRVFRAAPGALRQVNVRWARERCPNHLKQEGWYDLVDLPGAGGGAGGEKREEGDGAGGTGENNKEGEEVREEKKIQMLVCVERGIPLVGSPFVRRFRLRLERTPGRGRGRKAKAKGGFRVSSM